MSTLLYNFIQFSELRFHQPYLCLFEKKKEISVADHDYKYRQIRT